MTVLDAHVLLYAVDTRSVHHEVSRRWLWAGQRPSRFRG